ncbi:MAG: DNA-binding response regulator [Desulfuromonas sp.]|nr:MAG: DNA-binding response regulator [Desulfuromonas sp.]
MTATSAPVLIVEDDENTSSLVATYLQREGFHTLTAHDGEEGLRLARQCKPVFVILDIMLPRLDGWEICRQLRKTSEVPILILSAREEEIDRIMGLSIGADDYLVKPFSPRELVERVKAILRRVQARPPQKNQQLSCGGLVLDPDKLMVTLNGEVLSLTAMEFKLLQALMSTPGRVFSRDELLDRCYAHGETVIDRVVDVHVGKLRQKIEKDPANPLFILTVRGFGYRFTDRDER